MLLVDVGLKLGDFSLEAAFSAPDGVTAVFGPSGSGKSSLISALAGSVRPQRGHISLNGEALFAAKTGLNAPMEKRGVGLVWQEARLFPHLTVGDNLTYGARRAAGRAVRAEFDAVVEVLGLGALLARRPALLSGGERQRVALGRALLSQPNLLLLDEPMASLDQQRRAELCTFIARLAALYPLPVILVTHSLEEVVRPADQVLVLEAGRIIAAGSLGEVAACTPVLAAREDLAVALDGVVGPGGVVATAAGPIQLADRYHPASGSVRLQIRARDVLLAKEGLALDGLSARNVVGAHILDLTDRADGTVLVRLAAGGAVLLCLVTRDALEVLGLGPGVAVQAVFKSAALNAGLMGD